MRKVSLVSLFLCASFPVFMGVIIAGTSPPPTVEFPQSLHFLTPGGEDVVVEQGIYEVGQASEWLHLIPIGGEKTDAILVEAQPIVHEEMIAVPTTHTLSEHDDEVVVTLLLPDGIGLEAIGSHSGVRSKAARRQKLQGARMNQLLEMRRPSVKMVAPLNLVSVRAYDVLDGQPSYQVSYRRDPALELQLSGPQPTHIRIANNPSFGGAIWQPYRTKQTYRYPFPPQAGLGEMTLYVQVQAQSSPRMSPLLSGVQTAKIHLRQAPAIQSLSIAGSQGAAPGVTYGRNVTVTWTRTGQANIARVGEQAQLTDLHAMGNTATSGLTTSMSFQLSPGNEQKTIYVQLIDKPFANNPSVYARSTVASATINLQPIPSRTITFESPQDVSGVIDFAMEQGYTFEAWKSGGYEGECRFEKVDGRYNLVADLVYEVDGRAYGPGPSAVDVRDITAVRPIVCNFKLFTDKALQSPWKLKSAGIAPQTHPDSNLPGSWFFGSPRTCQGPNWQKTPSGISSDPAIKLSIHSTRVDIPKIRLPFITCMNHYHQFGPTMIYHLRDLKLEGPVNQEWQQAFQP